MSSLARDSAMTEIGDLIAVSWRQMVRTRPFGVIFSIAFGIAAFLILGVLGEEIRKKLNDDFLLMGGVNVLRVEMEDDRYPGSPPHYFKEKTLRELRKLDNVVMAGANVRYSPPYYQAVNKRNIPLRLVGIDEYFVPIYSLDVEAGRPFTHEDVEKRRRLCVLGHQAAVELFGSPENAVGKFINIGHNDIARVVGVVNGVMLASWTSYAFLPYTTELERGLSTPEMDRIFILAKNWETVPELSKNIIKRVRELQAAPHVNAAYQEEQFKRIDATFFWLSALLWLAIGMSLVLGAFGIWSGTFTSVRARTHEIGLKKAMGATNLDIMAQFLLEALFKSMVGGLFGLVIGIAAVVVGVHYLGCPFPLRAFIICGLTSLFFSAFLGIAGGIYPAMRASRMDVVDSLRFE